MTFDKEAIFKKINLLRNKVNSDSEAEALVAAAGIQRLMLAYQISEAELEIAEPTEEEVFIKDCFKPDSQGKNVISWQCDLLSTLARLNNCVLHIRKQKFQTANYNIYGKERNISIVKYLHGLFCREIENLSKVYAHKLTGKTQFISFKMGMAHKIIFRLEEANADEKKNLQLTHCSAIVKFDAELAKVHSFVDDMNLRLKKSNPRASIGDSNAYQLGKEAGNKVNIGNNQAKALNQGMKQLC